MNAAMPKRAAKNTQKIYKDTLPNGLVVISEPMPHVHSVSVGIWVRSGSRREPAELNGISHFIEHMVFKGTRRRTAEDIAREVDSVGGMLDAFTAKEMVCFNTKVLGEHLPRAFDIIADMALEPKFEPEDIAREQSVILEEIRMTQDNPEDLVHELFSQNLWASHAIGRPILGTPETVSSFTRDHLQDWFRASYAPNNLVITAAGNLTQEQLLDLVTERFSGLDPVDEGGPEPAPKPAPHVTLRSKQELEQVHICVGLPAFPMTDRRRFAVSVLNNVLGGGMSSRLFQNVRERLGLAYAIFSELNSYKDAGVLSVYAGTSLETAGKLVECVLGEFRRMRDEKMPDDELRRAKDHLKGATLLALESSGQRMNSLARYHIYFNRHFTPDQLIAMLEAVTAEEIQVIAQEFFQSDRLAASVVGSLNGFSLTRDQLVV
ncbi:MAG TPA: pitrilysin family protein [Candidatus Acidoferrales bacterium]|nr:pitrilysin family protein [Candidatus Acidoferrales bacterium]